MSFEKFDERAHELLSKLFDSAEERLVRQGICKACEADEYLTLEYIKASGEYHEYATVYLQSEGTTASEIFISKLIQFSNVGGFSNHVKRCAEQLSLHTELYFPKFRKMLTIRYLAILHSSNDLHELQRSGILLLAAATLPGAVAMLRREFRRKGLSYDRTLVSEDVLQMRIANHPQLPFVEETPHD